MKKLLCHIAFLMMGTSAAMAQLQPTSVSFNIQWFVGQGTGWNTIINLASKSNLLVGGNAFIGGPQYHFPISSTVPVVVSVLPGIYTMTISNVGGSWTLPVPQTNIVCNALNLITNVATFIPASLQSVWQIQAGSNVVINPASGQGIVTISSTASGGGSSIATNQVTVSSPDSSVSVTTSVNVNGATNYNVEVATNFSGGAITSAVANATSAAVATSAPYQNAPGNIVVTNELASTNFQFQFTVTPLTFDTNHWFSSGCNPSQANGTFTWVASMGMYSNSGTAELLMPTPFGVTGYYWILTQDTNYGNFDYDFGLPDQFLTNALAAHWQPNSGVSFGNGNYLTNSSLNTRTTTAIPQTDLNGTFEGAQTGGFMTNGTVSVTGSALTPQIIWNSFSNDVSVQTEFGLTNSFGYYKLVGLAPTYVTDFGFDPTDWISGTNANGVFTNITANFPDGQKGIANWVQSQGGRYWLGCLAGQNGQGGFPAGLQGVEAQNVNNFVKIIGIDGLFINCDGPTFTGNPHNAIEYELAVIRNQSGVLGWTKNVNVILNDAISGSHYQDGSYGRFMSQANGMLAAADGSTWGAARGAQWNNFIAGWHSNMKLLPYTHQGSYVNLSTTALFQNDTNMIKGLLGMMGVGPCTFYLDMTNYVGLQPTASLLTNQDWFFNVFKDTGGMPGQLIQSNNMSEIWLRPLTSGKWFLNFWNKDTNSSYTLTATLPFNLSTMTVKDVWAQTNVSLTGTSLACQVITNSSMSFLILPTIPLAQLPGGVVTNIPIDVIHVGTAASTLGSGFNFFAIGSTYPFSMGTEARARAQFPYVGYITGGTIDAYQNANALGVNTNIVINFFNNSTNVPSLAMQLNGTATGSSANGTNVTFAVPYYNASATNMWSCIASNTSSGATISLNGLKVVLFFTPKSTP